MPHPPKKHKPFIFGKKKPRVVKKQDTKRIMSTDDELRKTAQLLRFTEFLKENPQFIRKGSNPNKFQEKHEILERIADELNALGPLQRDWDRWYKYFLGLKQHVFGKVYLGKLANQPTGQHLDNEYQLTEWEKKVVECMLSLEKCKPSASLDTPGYTRINTNSSYTDTNGKDIKIEVADADCAQTSFGEEDMLKFVSTLKKEEEEDIIVEPCNFSMKRKSREDKSSTIKLQPNSSRDVEQEIIDDLDFEEIENEHCAKKIKLTPSGDIKQEMIAVDELDVRIVKQEVIESPNCDAQEEDKRISSSVNYEFLQILKDQTTAQKQFYEKMYDNMDNIHESLKSIEECIKLSVEQKHKFLELKKEKLKMYKEWKMEKKKIAEAKLQKKTEFVEFHERKPKGAKK